MSDSEQHPEIPEFHLPDWGTEGAPPPPPLDDDASDTGLSGEAREIALEVEADVVLTTGPLPADWTITDLLGIVTGVGIAEKDDPVKAATKAVSRALADLNEAALSIGANAVTDVRLDATGKKAAITVIAIGTAIRFSRE